MEAATVEHEIRELAQFLFEGDQPRVASLKAGKPQSFDQLVDLVRDQAKARVSDQELLDELLPVLEKARDLVDKRNEASHDVWMPPDVFGLQDEMERLAQRNQKTRPASKQELEDLREQLRACREEVFEVFYRRGLFLIDLA